MHDTPFELPRGVLGGGVAALVALRRRGGGTPRCCPGAHLLGLIVLPLAAGGTRSPPPLGGARCRPSRGAARRRGVLGGGVAALRCALPPWRRCAPSLSWRRLISVGPDSASRRRGARSPPPQTRATQPSRGAVHHRGVLGGGVRLALRSAAAAAGRPVAIPAPISVGPAVPLAVGGLSSALSDARGQPSRGTVGCHDALGSGVAVYVAPLRRGGSAPRRRPGDWHPSGGPLTVGGAQTVAPKA